MLNVLIKMLAVSHLFTVADKMARRLLMHTALSVVLLVAASINMASACSCAMSHPQTQACNADFGKNINMAST
jgi:hypothetical protein